GTFGCSRCPKRARRSTTPITERRASGAGRSDNACHSEQNGEAFLREVVVVGEDFGDAPVAHRLHGDAIGQAVALVRALLVERQSGEEGSPRLRQGLPLWIRVDVADEPNRLPPHVRTITGEEGEQLVENIVGCDEPERLQCRAAGMSTLVV